MEKAAIADLFRYTERMRNAESGGELEETGQSRNWNPADIKGMASKMYDMFPTLMKCNRSDYPEVRELADHALACGVTFFEAMTTVVEAESAHRKRSMN